MEALRREFQENSQIANFTSDDEETCQIENDRESEVEDFDDNLENSAPLSILKRDKDPSACFISFRPDYTHIPNVKKLPANSIRKGKLVRRTTVKGKRVLVSGPNIVTEEYVARRHQLLESGGISTLISARPGPLGYSSCNNFSNRCSAKSNITIVSRLMPNITEPRPIDAGIDPDAEDLGQDGTKFTVIKADNNNGHGSSNRMNRFRQYNSLHGTHKGGSISNSRPKSITDQRNRNFGNVPLGIGSTAKTRFSLNVAPINYKRNGPDLSAPVPINRNRSNSVFTKIDDFYQKQIDLLLQQVDSDEQNASEGDSEFGSYILNKTKSEDVLNEGSVNNPSKLSFRPFSIRNSISYGGKNKKSVKIN